MPWFEGACTPEVPGMRTGQHARPPISLVPPPAPGSKRDGVSDTPPPVTPSRSLLLGGVGVLLLCIPFFVFGLAFFDTKARVEFTCAQGGPCTLTRVGWLTREEVGTFPLAELQGARVDRSRSPRGEQQNIYRPLLLTTRGEFPLSAHWMDTERQAEGSVLSVERFVHAPGAPGFSMWHDDRPRASRMGMMFTVVAVGVLGLGLWLTGRGLKRRREERAAAA